MKAAGRPRLITVVVLSRRLSISLINDDTTWQMWYSHNDDNTTGKCDARTGQWPTDLYSGVRACVCATYVYCFVVERRASRLRRQRRTSAMPLRHVKNDVDDEDDSCPRRQYANTTGSDEPENRFISLLLYAIWSKTLRRRRQRVMAFIAAENQKWRLGVLVACDRPQLNSATSHSVTSFIHAFIRLFSAENMSCSGNMIHRR